MSNPYRNAAQRVEDPPVGRRILRPLCWIIGHTWRIDRVNQRKHINLIHLHPVAGMDATCTRCGDEWRDSKGFLWDDIVWPG